MLVFQDRYFSILSDSIGTFEGFVVPGYPSYYTKWERERTGVFGADETWWGRVIDHFSAKLLVNNSYSGSFVCRPWDSVEESYGCSDARTGNLHADGITPNHILIFMGTNDRGAGYRLTSQNKEDLTVIENAYGVMLDKIKKNYPAAEIWCLTFPITTCSRNPAYVFPHTRMGVPMAEFGAVIKAVATAKDCHVIDLWDEGDLCDTVEGLHPNYNGMKMIADRVIAAMTAAQA